MSQMRVILVLAAVCSSLIPVLAGEVYESDVVHGRIGFRVSHMAVGYVSGRFNEYAAELDLDSEGTLMKAVATIEVASIDTGSKGRDEHLQKEDFFDAAKYPQISFKSKSVTKDNGRDVIIADFTLRGVTREIELPYKITGPIDDSRGMRRIGFQAKLVIDRKDYGMTWNKVLDAGGLAVGNEVELQIDVEFTQPKN